MCFWGSPNSHPKTTRTDLQRRWTRQTFVGIQPISQHRLPASEGATHGVKWAEGEMFGQHITEGSRPSTPRRLAAVTASWGCLAKGTENINFSCKWEITYYPHNTAATPSPPAPAPYDTPPLHLSLPSPHTPRTHPTKSDFSQKLLFS